jgi:hypothetical protein
MSPGSVGSIASSETETRRIHIQLSPGQNLDRLQPPHAGPIGSRRLGEAVFRAGRVGEPLRKGPGRRLPLGDAFDDRRRFAFFQVQRGAAIAPEISNMDGCWITVEVAAAV